MGLNERREELLIWLADGPEIEAVADNWLCEVAQLEAALKFIAGAELSEDSDLLAMASAMKGSAKKALGGES